LLLAQTPLAPRRAVVDRIKRGVLARVAADGVEAARHHGLIDVRRDENWQPLADKAQIKVLLDDGITMSWLAKLDPGADLPGHDHPAGVEECLVLEGELFLNGTRLGAGDYQLAAVGTWHATIRSPRGCLLFVRSPSPRALNAGVPGAR
jgi:hypothetical protein